MTIDEKMISAVDEIIADHGAEYIATRQELLTLLHHKYGFATGRIIPSDYCYRCVIR